jgi:hypothetical protein
MSAASLYIHTDARNPADTAVLRQVLSEARTQAEQVKDETSRLVLLENLAAAEARAGNIKLAQSEAERLEPIVKAPPNYGDCNYIYEQILRAQARAGDYDAALRTIQRISGIGGSKDEGYYALAEELANQGKLDQVIGLIEQTSRPDNVISRARVFLELAVASTKSGDTEHAAVLFDRAESLSAQLLHEAGVQSASVGVFLDVAARRRTCGSPGTARRMFSEAQQVIGRVTDDSKRQQYLCMLASAAARGGDFDLAKEIQVHITDPLQEAQAGVAIVDAYLAEPIPDTESGRTVALNIRMLEMRISSLNSVAAAQARKGERDAARKTLNASKRLLELVADDWKPWGTLGLASAEYELGDRTQAGHLCDETIELTSRFNIHPERQRALALNEVAGLRASFGDEAGALDTARHAERDSLFEDIAEVEAEKGQASSALKWTEKLKDPEQKAGALLGIARGLLDKQQSSLEHKNASYPNCH